MEFTRKNALKGEITVPGDKSISHRAVMFGSLSLGTTEISNFLKGADCLSTIDCFRRLGIHIEENPDSILIHGKGIHGLSKPINTLDAGNSGTTTRLISGILAAQPFDTQLTGDVSIRQRPMKRITEPLSEMGADIKSIHNNDCAPLQITGKPLHGIHYHSAIASAQVKSSILLAGLYAKDRTAVTEPFLSRNHTELMLKFFGADVSVEDTTVKISPLPTLIGQKLRVPGDISSAAYFIAAGLLIPGSEIMIKNVGINPTRAGILEVALNMGGNITLHNESDESGELTADILVKYSELHSTNISGGIIPALIDELPIIAVMACFAKGTTIISDAAELKVKESNRIDVMVSNLSNMGADISATTDGMIINGGCPLTGRIIDSCLDHRIAMSFSIAGLLSNGVTTILGSNCIDISYPSFYQDITSLYP